MKRILLVLLILILTASVLSSCQDKNSGTAESQSAESAGKTAATNAQTTERETAVPAAKQSGGPVDAAWFDDAVFIGDSITLALDYACADDPSLLGNAKFVCAQSLGYHNALWGLSDEGAVHPTYQGQTILSETAAQVTGASKAFILLGVNDIGTYGADDTLEQAKELARRIKAASPDVTLYFQSTTPMIEAQESGWLNNDKITDFNTQLEVYCREQGYYFIDVYHQVCDENGKLREDYCGDPDVQGIHFNTEGCSVWADYLKAVVAAMPASSIGNTAPAPTAAAPTSAADVVYTGEAYDEDDSDENDEDDYENAEEEEEDEVVINYYVSDKNGNENENE